MSNVLMHIKNIEAIEQEFDDKKRPLVEEVFKDEDKQDLAKGDTHRLWKQLIKEQKQGFVKFKDFINPEDISEFNLMLL